MQTATRILNVFLASPDDVRPERVAAEEVVNDLNRVLIDRLGWQIRLHKWEDEAPAFGRPQEIINAAVDGCALFVGLLWERWGQATGKYSSGFEEEYERALERRRTTDDPAIWLVFKAVDPYRRKDPGPQLKKVLEFRSAQIALREVLFREIGTIGEWKRQLFIWLLDHLLKKAVPPERREIQPPSSAPEPASLDSSATETVLASTGSIEISQQLLQTASSLTRVIKSGDLEFARQEANLLQEFDVARLYLLSATWMSRRFTGDYLGTHEMNLLYKYRERLETTPTEYLQLLRAVIADGSGVVPGWFWFSAMNSDAVEYHLFMLASQDSSSEVRRRSLKLLREAKIVAPVDCGFELPLADGVAAVRAEAYRYLAAIADQSALSLVEGNIGTEGSGDGSEAQEARLSILLHLRPRQAFSELIQSGKQLSEERMRELKERAPTLDDEVLLKGAASESAEVRRFSVEELIKRGKLPNDLAERLTEDPSVAIRQLAFMKLAMYGRALDFSRVRKSLSKEPSSQGALMSLSGLFGHGAEDEGDPEAVILAFYRGQSPQKVSEDVHWFGIDGVLAYESLATDHYETIRSDLRPDLESGFARVRQQSVAEIESKLGSQYANTMVEQFRHLEDFIRSQFTEAALAGLVANGEPSDIRFGRQYLESEHPAAKLSAVRIVGRFGTAQDVPALIRIAKESWGEMRDEAGIAALRLSSNPFEVATKLTESYESKLVRAGYDWLYAQTSPEVEKFFDDLLCSTSDSGRVRSVYYFSKTRKREDLEAMLKSQLARETYYYNVISWLDRLLYSPPPLREFFSGELKRQAT